MRDDIKDLQDRIDFLEAELLRLESVINDVVSYGFWIEYTNDRFDN
jgi:hypothetical protein